MSETVLPLRILAWHGFWGGGEDWAELRRHAARLGLVLPWACPDLPGHGGAGTLGPVLPFVEQTQLFAGEIGAHFARTGQRTILLGYSLGGRLALSTALQTKADALVGLVLISTSPGLSDPEAARVRAQEDDYFATRLAHADTPMEDLLREFWTRPVFRSPHWPPSADSAWTQRRLQADRRALAAALRLWSVGRQPNLWPLLPDSQLPVLLVHGAYDEKFARLHERMAALLPRGKSLAVPDCGHVALSEQPALLAETLFPEGNLPFSEENLLS